MTDTPETPETPQTPDRPEAAERIAKVMARVGVASRREAERMILEGRVTVNGQKIDSPALDVLPDDRISVDGKRLDEKQETRLWLYYKPAGLVTSESDEKGRQTVFDALPRDLPRVMTVGRLDLNSEGLLLLTNDGELKRRLELPATGWLRRYRVRVNGTPNDLTFAPLRRGVTIDGEDFAPMEIKLDSQQGANAWLTVGIREGRNREIRRAMAHVGLQVNRLIRVGYGPFKLAGLEKNEVAEVKRRVLRDQLGGLLTGEVEEKEREMRPRGAEGGRPVRAPRPEGDGEWRPRHPRAKSGEGEARPARSFRSDDGAERPARTFGARAAGPRKDRGEGRARFGSAPGRGEDRKFGEGREGRKFGGKPSGGGQPSGERGFRGKSDGGDRPARKFGDDSRFGRADRTGSDRAGGEGRRDGEFAKGKPPARGKPGGSRFSKDAAFGDGGKREGGGSDARPAWKGKPGGAGKGGFSDRFGGGAGKGGPRPAGPRTGGKPSSGPRPSGSGGKPGGKPAGRPRG